MFRVLVSLLSVGYAFAANTVIRPAANEVIQADGGSYGIQWTPDSSDTVVSIALINGSTPVSTIASQISNTGMFVWIISRSLTAGRYTIAIAGGASGASPTDFSSSGEFIITGPSALSSSITVASSMSSMASNLEVQLSSLFQVRNSSAPGNITATPNSTLSSASGMSGTSTLGTATLTEGGATIGTSTAAGTGGTIGAPTPSSSAGATGTSGTEPLVRHADFAVIIFALVCVLMQI